MTWILIILVECLSGPRWAAFFLFFFGLIYENIIKDNYKLGDRCIVDDGCQQEDRCRS